MFGSQILEVGIGLILVFLLVSLVLTAVREAIEAWMKTRATDLERAIAELLDDQGGAAARARFYHHPLVTALFPGAPNLIDFSATGWVHRLTWPFRTGRNLPSYIPRETFSLAVEDLVRNGTAGTRLSAAHQALSEGLGGDPAGVRKGVEQLYDAAMDRASGWYKRRTQWILFWLGLVIALVLNINAFAIAQHLATNDAARAKMIGIAQQLQGEPTASGGPQNATTSTPASGGDPAPRDRDEIPAAEAAQQLNALVQAAGLPIGWDEVQVARIREAVPDEGWARWLALLVLALGYLSVALAATLGAPFWFDVLGKFMVVRSTVKPTEKSPDETSKDGGTGGAPKPRGTGEPGGAGDTHYGRPEADRAIQTPQPVIFG